MLYEIFGSLMVLEGNGYLLESWWMAPSLRHDGGLWAVGCEGLLHALVSRVGGICKCSTYLFVIFSPNSFKINIF